MGGGAAVVYAGTEPERVRALVSIEGLGLPGACPDAAPDHFRAWLGDLERAAQRQRRELGLEAIARRLRERFPGFSAEVARHMAQHGTRPHGAGRVWKFDPLHQTRSPQPYYVAQARAFWQRVACPVLYVEGGRTPLRLPPSDLEERLASLRAERLSIEGSGHHPHLERPEALAQVLVEFLQRAMR
jgi:pimeloyl-ACP methyl ester carboxylesterase